MATSRRQKYRPILAIERAYLQTIYEHLVQAQPVDVNGEFIYNDVRRRTKNGKPANRNNVVEIELYTSTMLVIFGFRKSQSILMRIYRAMDCSNTLLKRYYEMSDPTAYDQIVKDIQKCCEDNKLHPKIL